MSGTEFGRWLSTQNLSPALSRAVVVTEVLSLPLTIHSDIGRRAVGLSNMTMHIGSSYAMRISYWHLAWLTAVLLVLPNRLIRILMPATDDR
jgi:hypothetical protein